MLMVFGKCVFWLLLLEFTGLAVKESLSSGDQIKREHSLVRPFRDMDMNLSFWDVMGHTVVTKDYIRLTQDLQSSSGAIWNNSTCQAGNWEVHVTFRIHGERSDKDHTTTSLIFDREIYGNGLAVWYSKERMQPGPAFGNTECFSGLGVFVDTRGYHIGPDYVHHSQSYLTAILTNLSWSSGPVLTRAQLMSCGVSKRFRNTAFETLISIRYEKDVLTVSTNAENPSEWKTCFKINDVALPTGYFFGISAATSDLSDNHDILGFNFYDLDLNVSSNGGTFVAQPEHKGSPKLRTVEDNILIFLVLLFGVTAVVAGAFLIFSIYKFFYAMIICDY